MPFKSATTAAKKYLKEKKDDSMVSTPQPESKNTESQCQASSLLQDEYYGEEEDYEDE
jgi:hypothetical protein